MRSLVGVVYLKVDQMQNNETHPPPAGQLCELQHQLEDQPVYDVQRPPRGGPQRSECWLSCGFSNKIKHHCSHRKSTEKYKYMKS